jgi:hypothetical protein
VLIFSWIIVFLRTVSAGSSDAKVADAAARHRVATGPVVREAAVVE